MKQAGSFEKREYGLSVVTTLYLGRVPPEMSRRLVVVVFSIRREGVGEYYVAYGVDPDAKQVLFSLQFRPKQLRAVLKALIDDVVAVIAAFNHMMGSCPRGGKLQLVEGAVNTLRPLETKASMVESSAAAASRPPPPPPPPSHEPPESNAIIVPGDPPPDTGPRIAQALADAAASSADLVDVTSDAA